MSGPLGALGGELAAKYASGFLPLPAALFLHSMFVAQLFAPGAELAPWWLVSWTIVFVGSFGGGLTTAALMGVNPLGFLTDNVQIPAFTAAWWLITYFPYGKWMWEATPLHLVCPAVSHAIRVATICGRGALARKLWPESLFAPLFMGVVGGTGGKFISDLLLHIFYGPSRKGLALELVRPSWTLRSAVAIFVAHYALAVAEWGPQWEERAAVMTIQGTIVSHALLVMAWPRGAGPRPSWIQDPSAGLTAALHALLLVPVPPGSSLTLEKVDVPPKRATAVEMAPSRGVRGASPGGGPRAGVATPPPSARRAGGGHVVAGASTSAQKPPRRSKKDL